MKKVFVLIPPEYGISDEAFADYEKRREDLAHKAEIKIGEYCEISYLSPNIFYVWSMCEDDLSYGRKKFIRENIEQLFDSDYAVFGEDWDKLNECRFIYDVAEKYGVPILEV